MSEGPPRTPSPLERLTALKAERERVSSLFEKLMREKPELREEYESVVAERMAEFDTHIQQLEAQTTPVTPEPPGDPVVEQPAAELAQAETARGDLTASSETLFRRIGASPADIDAASKQVLSEVGYFERKNLQDNEVAQKIAGALQVASSQWEHRTDRTTIPDAYKSAFEDFIQEYAPGMGFEVVWGNRGEGERDSEHESSRVAGVAHHTIGGTRRPGLRKDGQVYLRAKVAIF